LLRDCTCHQTEVPSLEQTPLAQRITRARRLDLDDVRAKVGQRFGRKRASDQLPQLDDLEPGSGPAADDDEAFMF